MYVLFFFPFWVQWRAALRWWSRTNGPTKRKLKLLTSGAMINAKETRTALALLFAPLVKAGDPVVPCRAFYFLWVSPWWQMYIPIQDNHSQSNLSEIIGTCLLPVVRRVSEQISTTACPGHAIVWLSWVHPQRQTLLRYQADGSQRQRAQGMSSPLDVDRYLAGDLF